MRVAVVHSFYTRSQPSGENRVVEDQITELIRTGHDVSVFGVETDSLFERPGYRVRTAMSVATRSGRDPTRWLNGLEPDVVHVYNLFPNLSSRWVREWHGPLVHSVHNYRAVCSNGLLFRDGAICTQCPESGSLSAVVHRCYRGSFAATLPVAVSRAGYRRDVLMRADAIITTSALSDEVLKTNVPFPLVTEVIPNFCPEESGGIGVPSKPFTWLALGRFTQEKGFLQLVRDWPKSERLLLVGDGPLRADIEALARPNSKIELRPSMSLTEMRDVLGKAYGLIFPSRWFEADPQVVVEAMRLGIPVVAYSVNAGAMTVVQTQAGATYGDAASLAMALDSVQQDRDRMSERARQAFEDRWTRVAWRRKVDSVYRRVVARWGGDAFE